MGQRKTQANAIGGPGARERRGWGPFTGGQLTTIIIAVVVMVMLPIGAWAVSGSNVFVTDAVSGQRATVNGAGSLNVAQASPKTFFNRSRNAASADFLKIVSPTPGHALVVTSININASKVTTPGPTEYVQVAISKNNDTCLNVVFDPVNDTPALTVNLAGVGLTSVPLQPGLVVPEGRALCTKNNEPANIDATVHAFGFSVPGAAAPPGAGVAP